MTPSELAALHPRLYHITSVGSWELISRIGLLSTYSLLAKFGGDEARVAELTKKRRPKCVQLSHESFGDIQISDNLPLSEKKLLSCLDDGILPSQWFEMLNRRVFFWVDRKKIDGMANSNGGRKRSLEVLEFDTLSLASDNFKNTEITRFNTGNTNHKAAQRGLGTFSRLADVSYADWRRNRSKIKKTLDNIAEVTVVCGIENISRHLISRKAIS